MLLVVVWSLIFTYALYYLLRCLCIVGVVCFVVDDRWCCYCIVDVVDFGDCAVVCGDVIVVVIAGCCIVVDAGIAICVVFFICCMCMTCYLIGVDIAGVVDIVDATDGGTAVTGCVDRDCVDVVVFVCVDTLILVCWSLYCCLHLLWC